MAQQIAALTPIDPFPSRILPQDRFDQAVRTNMSQLSGMIGELNDSFIPSVNTISTQVETDTETASTAATTATNKASDATTAANTATTKASQASTSATNAANSATAAANSATAAGTSATNAANSATAAANSATAASTSATTATNKASEATTAASTATTKATQASTSETNAANSATAASTSATNAASSASTATTKASDATTAANTATTKASQASTSATNAANSATAAANSATAAATTVSAIMVNSGDDGAASHNCFYRGKNLTNVYTLTQLSTKMTNGDFSDLYIGDYWTLPVVVDGTSNNFNFRIAHFNYWKYMGDTSFTKNHIVFIPDKPFKNMKMQNTNTTEGGVPATLVWAALQNELYTAVNAATCMNGHVQTHRDFIPDSVNTSAMSAAGAIFQGSTVYTSTMWRDVKLGLMKEPMVYGSTVFSSSGYDVGCGKSQLALFKLEPTWINGRSNTYTWWLGCVSSSTYFCRVYENGVANYYPASTPRGVRPYLLFA